jgi:hypothetical protein
LQENPFNWACLTLATILTVYHSLNKETFGELSTALPPFFVLLAVWLGHGTRYLLFFVYAVLFCANARVYFFQSEHYAKWVSVGCVWRVSGSALLILTAGETPPATQGSDHFWYAIVSYMISHVAFAISNYKPDETSASASNSLCSSLGTAGSLALVASDCALMVAGAEYDVARFLGGNIAVVNTRTPLLSLPHIPPPLPPCPLVFPSSPSVFSHPPTHPMSSQCPPSSDLLGAISDDGLRR